MQEKVEQIIKNIQIDLLEIHLIFSVETIKARWSWKDILQTLNDHKCQTRLQQPEKLPITRDRENKIFYNKSKSKQYLSTNTALQKVLEGEIQSKEVNYIQENTRK